MIEHKYIHEIFKALPTPSVILLPDSPKFTILDANDAYEEITNMSRDRIVGESFLDLLQQPFYKIQLWQALLDEVIATKKGNKTPVFDYEVVKGVVHEADIRKLFTSNTPVLDDQNEIAYIIRTVTDVTELFTVQESEEQVNSTLSKNEKLLDETQRVARIGSWEIDLGRNHVTWSEVMREIHEVDADYIPKKENLGSFFKAGESRKRFEVAFDEAVELASGFDLELTLVSAKGNERLVRLTGKVEAIDGLRTRVYGAMQDVTDRQLAQKELTITQGKFQNFVETVDGIVWEADPNTFEFSFVGDQVKYILGYTPAEWLSEPDFWAKHIHQDDVREAIAFCRRSTEEGKNHSFDYRMIRKDGRVIWIRDIVSVICEDGVPVLLRGIMTDHSETMRFTELESLEKRVLELNSQENQSLPNILTAYLIGLEALFPHMICSILRIKNNRLQHWASPSLPPSYVASIDGLQIGENTGSCGVAAWLKKPVIVSDIANDPIWENYKHLALPHNLRACWSHPIIDSEGTVVATLGIYYKEVKFPEAEELLVIERAKAILNVLIENRLKSERLEETYFLMNQGQELAHFGNWQWDIDLNAVTWSNNLYTIYGLDKSNFKATFEGYQELLHPEDKFRVYQLIKSVLEEKRDIVFEERIIRPSGEIRHLKSWGRVKTDDRGNPVKMVGACLDITESRMMQEELRSSESRLRSLVDAQTNYVIRIGLDWKYSYYNRKYKDDFSWFYKGKDIIGKSCLSIVITDHRERILQTSQRCIAEPGRVFQVEIDKVGKTGRIISTLWDFVGLAGSDGRTKEIQCTGLDITDKKKIEDALKIGNERYEYVNKATNDAIYDWDLVSDHIAWGDGYQRLFGHTITDDKYPFAKWATYVHPDDFKAVNYSLQKALDNRDTNNWKGEYRFRTANGNYAYVQENSYILKDPKGRPVRMIGVLRDISERKNTQIKLMRKTKFLAAIAEVNSCLLHYHDWFTALDKSFDIVGWTVGVDRVYYFENDLSRGKMHSSQKFEWNSGAFESQIDNPKLQNVSHDLIWEMIIPLAQNKPYTANISTLFDSEFKRDLLDQDVKALLIFPVFVKNVFYGYLGFEDCKEERNWDEDEISFLKTIAVNLAKVMESEQAEKALIAAYEEKNKTLESIQDGFFAVSKDWDVSYWNGEAENLLGIKRADILGKYFWDIYEQPIPSRYYTEYEKKLNQNIPVRFEEYYKPLRKWFEVNVFPAKDGLTIYFKDITERKQGEDKLKELHLELENNLRVLAISNAELEQFAYVASHDLQEPLRMVTSFLTLLEKKYADSLDEKAHKYIYFAVDGAKRMRQIILDLLDFSRVGKISEKIERVSTQDLITDILSLYRKRIEEKNALIEFSGLPDIEAFRAPVAQVFQNLISNGLKYQPAGQRPKIIISSEENATHWIFVVKDNGIGIDSQYFDKIFIIFQRLHNKEEYSGTGMGLAITKKIVENLGGKIWVESLEGGGSTFYFTIAKKQLMAL